MPGGVIPERAAFADQVQQLAGIPYILVDDSFVRMPAMLRGIGAVLGDAEQRSISAATPKTRSTGCAAGC